jgi:tRNA isopentenyl-2-thiomethyl-A-37 hydroxylase MiaE
MGGMFPEDGVSAAQAAAAQAVAMGEASALTGVVRGNIAYLLTYNMIRQNLGALSFPLITLASTAITAGLEAYVRTQERAAQTDETLSAAFREAEQSCQAEFQKATRRLAGTAS